MQPASSDDQYVSQSTSLVGLDDFFNIVEGSDQEQLDELVRQLERFYTTLDNVNYRIGYLESQLTKHKAQAAMLEKKKKAAGQVSVLYEENGQLKERIHQISDQAEMTEIFQMENAELKARLEELQRHHISWWKHTINALTGIEQTEMPRNHSMSDYYDMLRQSLTD